MASPVQPEKKSVDLGAAGTARPSRIRRDPPQTFVKDINIADIQARDSRTVVIGVVVCAMALFAVMLIIANAAGWTPSQYTIRVQQGE